MSGDVRGRSRRLSLLGNTRDCRYGVAIESFCFFFFFGITEDSFHCCLRECLCFFSDMLKTFVSVLPEREFVFFDITGTVVLVS